MTQEADICIVCEGSYPHRTGGVAQWVHELISEHQERTFHVLSLVPPHPDLKQRYIFPKNVVGHTVYIVQDLPRGSRESRIPPDFWQKIGPVLKGMMHSPVFGDFAPILEIFRREQKILGKRILSESESSWNFFVDLYEQMIPSGPFKAYFATAFTLSRSFFSILLPELPKARLFHAVCTGYAGFILYRAKKERDVPCFITEHGIYSNERRIEVAMADWIAEVGSLDLALEDKQMTLKDFWLNAFLSFAHACYTSCNEVFSTYDGNHPVQIAGGADPAKVRTIVHGIKQEKLAALQGVKRPHPPTVALMGRIVPIKDVKTYIRACALVKKQIPSVRFFGFGSMEEDLDYAKECQELVTTLDLQSCFTFPGNVDLEQVFPEVDLLVLTSISEAQPLVILESGAAGIPCVATDVGGCSQLLYGRPDEEPPLGPGGIIVPLVNPEATAAAIVQMLTDQELYQRCSRALKKRIQSYYRFEQQHEEYRKLYTQYLGRS
jgi:glycosyltransferase involved in cell wall biosynthesis